MDFMHPNGKQFYRLEIGDKVKLKKEKGEWIINNISERRDGLSYLVNLIQGDNSGWQYGIHADHFYEAIREIVIEPEPKKEAQCKEGS